MLNDHLLLELASLNLNLARLKCLTLLLSSMLRQRTVNLTILATENLTGAKNESCYRRFQNFTKLTDIRTSLDSARSYRTQKRLGRALRKG